ncbi:hypothetical protein ACI2OX_01660 [Bacillus sp. N9]
MMELYVDADKELIDLGTIVWGVFARKRNPTFGSQPCMQRATLLYFDNQSRWNILYSKELTEIYEVSTTSLSRAYRSIKALISDEIDNLDDDDRLDEPAFFNPLRMEAEMRKLTEMIENEGLDSEEEIQQFLDQLNEQQPFNFETPGERTAHDLIHEAYEVQGGKRIELAKKALKLDRNCVDAFNILGEEAKVQRSFNVL